MMGPNKWCIFIFSHVKAWYISDDRAQRTIIIGSIILVEISISQLHLLFYYYCQPCSYSNWIYTWQELGVLDQLSVCPYWSTLYYSAYYCLRKSSKQNGTCARYICKSTHVQFSFEDLRKINSKDNSSNDQTTPGIWSV
jgi:hypothetical protein